jgi:chromosomal replication initiation ATPase DnaA
MSGPSQLPLALPHSPNYEREDFMRGPSNQAALRLIESWPDWPQPIVLLSGPPGAGKTHLTNIWSALAAGEILPALELQDKRVLPHAAAKRALAIEDVQPEQVPEAGLFHLINSVRELGGTLLLTSRRPAEDWRVELPDLRSRLRQAASVALGAPEDELLRQVLVKLFTDRQLVVEKPVIDYLVSRMERSLGAAIGLVEMLDKRALAGGRRITRAMAAEIVASAAETEEFADRQ